MYRVYDTFEKCCYTIKEAENVKKRNPTAPPERWLFVAVHDDMPDDMVCEDLVVVRPYLPNRELCLGFCYSLKMLRSNRFIKNIQHARKIHAEKQGVRVVRVAIVFGNKKTLESLLDCRIG